MLAFTPATKADVQRYDDLCGAEKNVPADRIAEFKKNQFGDDQLSKCHIECVAEKMQIFDKSEGLLFGNLVRQLLELNPGKSESELRDQAKKCTETRSEDFCDWAFVGFSCLQLKGLRVSPDVN